MDRRRFLASSLAGLVGAGLASPVRASARSQPRFLGARDAPNGRSYASAFDLDGRLSIDVPTPGRGHGAAFDSGRGEAVVFSRRPGTWLTVIDTRGGELLREISATAGRSFNGHGCFCAGHLFVSETLERASLDTAPAGRGLIGVYDPGDGYRRIGEFPSHGLDPHDLRAVDGETLVVANGGLLIDRDAPRIKLNLATMDPSLAYFDARNGQLVAQHRLAATHHQLSIRHLAVAGDATVAIAMQYEGPSTARPPLLALHRDRHAALSLVEFPDPILASLRNYCGSATTDTEGRTLAISSPRGGLTAFVDIPSGRLVGTTALADGCGLAASGRPGGFILSSGLGGVITCDAGGAAQALPGEPLARSRWDNHLLALH